MTLTKRQSNRRMAAIGSEYVDRMFKSPQNGGSSGSAKTSARSKSTGGKSSKVTKEFVQAYEWSQKELMSPGNRSTKTKATANRSSLPKTKPLSVTADHNSLPSTTRRAAQREPLSPVTFPEMLASNDMHIEAPSRPYCEQRLEPPPVMRYHRVQEPVSHSSENKSKREARQSSTLSKVVPILLAIIFIAICDLVGHLLMRTNLLSDLGAQFTAFFLKATFQVLIVMYILAKVHRDGYIQRSLDRRSGFRDFMLNQEGKMIEAHKLRSWFGASAVFDPKYLTKWTDENRCEFWQCRSKHEHYY